SVAIENSYGLRFGDSYSTVNSGHITATNSIFYNNAIYNVRNYTKAEQGPFEGGIDVTFSMTNDSLYDQFTGNITGIPLFDDNHYLLPQSPGASAGTNGTNMGLIDVRVLQTSSVVINEIMYKAAAGHDTDDWIELYNPSINTKNIAGWIIKDNKDVTSFTLPQNTFISGIGYLVLCIDTVAFKNEHPDITNIIGNLPFGLSKDGDMVRIFNSAGLLIDEVNYGVTSPWPSSPRGDGPSLELTNPLADNSIADSWIASAIMNGTPGLNNTLYTSINEKKRNLITDYQLFQNYPNPFN
ncbi:MAG: lamin tail domain-containing protein, partial [Gammaproteobacteria bacterium]|nr:lamin tail domain-containing protein [Gammaproteobacteria bacterium]